jgi:outer membrane protein insertion porin family
VTREYKLKNTVDRLNVPDANGNIVNWIDTNGNKVTDFNLAAADVSKVDQSVLNG